MRHLFAGFAVVAVLLATGAVRDHAVAADVGPPPYGPPSAYGPPPGYSTPYEYGPPPGNGPPANYGPSDDYGPSPYYDPPLRPPRPIPYAASPIRPACDLQWRCGPRGCGWRRVCYPEVIARPYRGYGPPPGPGYYGPY